MKGRALVAAGGLLVLGLLGGCAVGPGYDGYAGVAYAGDYWEPWGYDYGGWGGRYRVGPPRGDHWRGGGGHPGGEGSRPAGGHFGGGGRAAPSIPSRRR